MPVTKKVYFEYFLKKCGTLLNIYSDILVLLLINIQNKRWRCMLVSSVHSFLTSREASVLTPASQRSVLLQFASNISSASFYPLGICRGMWLFFSDTGIEGRLIVGGNTIFILTQELRGILIPVPIRLKDNSCLKLELKP